MSTRSVEVASPAYTTMMLHCAKYPASEVMGFLLGSITSSGIQVEKAIAVQHHWNRLSPMVEVAASLVQAYAASLSPKLQLIGLYHAASEISASEKLELNLAAAKVAQSLSLKLSNDAIVLQINNAMLGSIMTHALQGYSVSISNPNQPSAVAIQLIDEDVVKTSRKATIEGVWKRIYDFDDHLEDPTLNWLEPRFVA